MPKKKGAKRSKSKSKTRKSSGKRTKSAGRAEHLKSFKNVGIEKVKRRVDMAIEPLRGALRGTQPAANAGFCGGTFLGPSDNSGNGLWSCLNAPTAMVGPNHRLEDVIKLKSLYITGAIRPLVAGHGSENYQELGFISTGLSEVWPSQYLRLLVVYDRQPVGVTTVSGGGNPPPILQELLLSQNNTDGTMSSALDQSNMYNMERFLILADKRIRTPPVAWAGYPGEGSYLVGQTVNEFISCDPEDFNIKMYLKLKDLPTVFRSVNYGADGAAPGGTYAGWQAIETGALWMCLVAADLTSVGVANGSVTTAEGLSQWGFQGSVRLRFSCPEDK